MFHVKHFIISIYIVSPIEQMRCAAIDIGFRRTEGIYAIFLHSITFSWNETVAPATGERVAMERKRQSEANML